MKIASVIMSNSAREVDREFDYYIPLDLENFINIGSSVIVPFGNYNSETEAYVVDIKDNTDFKGGKIKSIIRIVEDKAVISQSLLNLAYYIKEKYLCTLSSALKLMLPPKKTVKQIITYSIKDINLAKDFIEKNKRAKKQVEVISKIINLNKNIFTQKELLDCFGASTSVIKSLVDKNILGVHLEEVSKKEKQYEVYKKPILTNDQNRAIEDIISNFKYGKNISLIHGVTGCGKTEVYLNLVEMFIKEDYGAIVLVPEIALTPQIVERFKGRFGDTVAIIHSRLNDSEKYDQYKKIKSGEYKVVVGARSAVFSPIKDLKLIIIDEEHEYSYKSESSPRYLTHDVAKFRINQVKGCLVLGSATPSIESYYKAKIGEYNLIKIDKRVKNIPMPNVEVVNMKEELMLGNKSMFSRKLYSGIKDNLKEKNQTILFLNRRGHSTFVSCRSCGYVCECEDCTVTLTYHSSYGKLKCHHCNKEYTIPNICPKCKSKYIKYFGVGTEKVEKEVQKYFSDAKIMRMDVDTTRKKGEHEKLYKEFKNKNKDILIGTQMISKGMDFEDVTLVGVISADITLNIPDFRSSEKTFQVLTQVSGRAGRGDKKGEVIIQTYNPEHFSIKHAKNHDYDGFYNKEIENRKLLNYPPFSSLMHVVFTSENENMLKQEMERLSIIIKKDLGNISIIGPSPCHIVKVKNKYRWHVIFKGDIDSIKNKVLDLIQKNMQNKGISFIIDIDPYTLI